MRVTSASQAEGRPAVWEKLESLDSPHLQRAIGLHVAEQRVEIWSALPGQSLRSWRATHDAPSMATWRRMIGQILAGIEAVHRTGVGHFALNADTVYIDDTEAGPVLTIGGFENAALGIAPGLITIPVDTRFAPPEAVGLFKHSPGELLFAWDWWSLGRLVQEIILGRHPAELLPEKILIQLSHDVAKTAEALLSERDLQGLRAGAVEVMTGLEPSMAALLRGLLTTACTGRWGVHETKEWLEGSPPKDHYGAPRQEKFFRHHGRGYTVPEFACFVRESQSSDAVRQTFAAEEKDTVAYFLAESGAHKDHGQKLTAARELASAVALRHYAEPMRKEIAAAVAMNGLAGGSFRWRGQVLTDVKLRECLNVTEQFDDWRTALLALATPLVLNFINVHDPDAVRLLEQLVQTAMKAEVQASSASWLTPTQQAPRAALWLLAMEPETKLAIAGQSLRERYAASDDPVFQAMFTAPNPSKVMLVLIAWAEHDPQRFRMVTHDTLRRRRQAELVQEAGHLVRIIFWFRLERAMRAGLWLFGGHGIVLLAGLMILSLLAVHVPGPKGVALGLIPVVALAASRMGVNRWQARLIREWSPESRAWTWSDGPIRCRQEVLHQAKRHGIPITIGGAQSAFKIQLGELKKLTVPNEPQVAPPMTPRHTVTWATVFLSWLIVIGLVYGSIRRGLAHPPSWRAHVSVWQKSFEKEKPKPKPVKPEDMKITWPFRNQGDAFELTIKGSFEPNSEQMAAAIRRGKELVKPYKPETITSPIAIFLPLANGEGAGGLLLFDSKKGALFMRKGLVIDFIPYPRMWLQIGDQLAFFIEK